MIKVEVLKQDGLFNVRLCYGEFVFSGASIQKSLIRAWK